MHDAFRVGALRIKREGNGDFLDNRQGTAAPSFVRLRELEAASLALERDEDNQDPAGNDWLRMLIAPGGSLGGAPPKASVVDPTSSRKEGDDAAIGASYLELARVLIDHGAQTHADLSELRSA